MEPHIFLNAFIEKFNHKKLLLSVTTFSELYDEIITDSYQLQKEINEYLLSFHPENKELYLNYVKERINVEILGGIDSSIIDKWTVLFDLNNIDFPFIENEKILTILSTWIDQPDLSFDDQKLVINIQHDFYLYAFYLEANKIITFINQLLSKKNNSIKSKIEPIKYFLIKDSSTRHYKAQSLSEKLISKNYISKECKANFINAFSGTKPKEKIDWIGDFGDLKSFIKYCNTEKLFNDNIDIWVIAAEVFTFKKVAITSRKIKDTKITKNDLNVKTLVKSIF